MTDLLEKLSKIRSGATTLITYYIAGASTSNEMNRNLWLAVEHFNNEKNSATNIKDKNVGKSIMKTLNRIEKALTLYKIKNDQNLNGYIVLGGDIINLPSSKCCL